MKTDKPNWTANMPAIVTIFALVDFTLMGAYVLYKALNPGASVDGKPAPDTAKLFSIVDMIVVATLNFVSMCIGYWVGTTHSNKMKDQMLYNSTPTPEPTGQAVTSTTTSVSTSEPEAKP